MRLVDPNRFSPTVADDLAVSRTLLLLEGMESAEKCVVVGGRYDTKEVWAQREKSISWTAFYLACLINKEAVLCSEAKPIYQIVASITRPCLSVADLRYLNRYGRLHQRPFAQSSTEMELQIGPAHPSPPTELFIEPVVVEVVGAGSDHPANKRLLTCASLKSSRFIAIEHFGLSHFAEYQRLGQESMAYMLEGDAKSKSAFLMKLRLLIVVGSTRGPFGIATPRLTTCMLNFNSETDSETEKTTMMKLRPAITRTGMKTLRI